MSDIILNNLVTSTNPMKAGDECFLCVLCKESKLKDVQLLKEYYALGRIIANNADNELPVYPDLDCIIRDTIEATFNPDIDKTMHFDLGDVDDLHIFKVKLLVDANPTFSKLVYTVNACIVGPELDMAPIRTEMKLKGIKYGKQFDTDSLSAAQKQRYEQSGISKIIAATKDMNPDSNMILNFEDMLKTTLDGKKIKEDENKDDNNEGLILS